MPAARSSKSEAIITVFCRLATLLRASVDGPGIVSANLKSSMSSVWQKYCDRNSSCRQTICAPFLTASPMREIAFFRFASGFDSQAIWIRPTLTLLAAAFLTMRRSIAKRKRPRCPERMAGTRHPSYLELTLVKPKTQAWKGGAGVPPVNHADNARATNQLAHDLKKAWLAPAVALRIRWRV